MDKVLECLVGGIMFLPWRPIVMLLAAIWFVNISGVELYDWRYGLGLDCFIILKKDCLC